MPLICTSAFLRLRLTVHRCRKDGYLFDKEAILEYVLTKKREYARKLKEYEKQKQKEEVRLSASLIEVNGCYSFSDTSRHRVVVLAFFSFNG